MKGQLLVFAIVLLFHLKNAIAYCEQSGVSSSVSKINVIDVHCKTLRELHAHLMLLVDSKVRTARDDKCSV